MSPQNRLEAQQRDKVYDLRQKLKQELETITEHHARIKEELSNAYTVELTRDKTDMESKLADLRASNAARVENEKMAGDIEVEKTKKAYVDQLHELKDSNEKNLAQVRRKYEQALAEMRRRNEKATS